jgi:TonB-dependent receptor
LRPQNKSILIPTYAHFISRLKLKSKLRMTISLRLLFFALLFSLAGSLPAQDNAKLTGKITDKDSGEELVGASVLVVGTKTGVKTNIDGIYTLNLPAGKYDIRVSYVGYKPRTIKDVNVKVGFNKQDVQLKADLAEAEEIVVQADVSNSTENALLTQQRKSSTVQDAISSEQIKKTPDSDAAESAKRITGVTVVGNKFVYVRGLGERYSSTQLNGVNVPSPEPEKKVVPFDIIPANLVENITTIKTFLPDQPGNFAGGLVRIKTKDFPEKLEVNVGSSFGYNNRSHFQSLPNYPSGGRDFLGFDDGLRALPASFPPPSRTTTVNANGQEPAGILSQLNNGIWTPRSGRFAVNQGYNISFGNQFNTSGTTPIGFIASLTYGSDVNYKEQSLFSPNFVQPDVINYRYNTRVSTYNVNLGGLANLNFRLGNVGKVGIKTTFNRAAEDETRIALGEERDNIGLLTRSTRLRFITRELTSTQLSGNFALTPKSEIDLAVQYATAKRDEPDNRETQFTGDSAGVGLDQTTFSANSNGRNQRFFSFQNDRQWDGLFNWTTLVGSQSGLSSKIKFGAMYSIKERDFAARRLAFRSRNFNRTRGASPDNLFSPDSVATGAVDLVDETLPPDIYEAIEIIKAGYAMMEFPFNNQLRFIGGVRLEQNILDVRSASGISFNSPNPQLGGFNNTNWLPSLNLIYTPVESMNFRLAASQTVAQPEMREVAPFRYDDFISENSGNPFLIQTNVRNYDFRWEWYPNFGEIISVSFFYKDLKNPLERVIDLSSAVSRSTIINATRAINYGVEFDIRKRLGFIHKSADKISLGLNLAFINSEITVPDRVPFFNNSTGREFLVFADFQKEKRPLQGQSPYVFNTNISYDNRDIGLSIALLYNISGRRISQLGADIGTPVNVYEEARNQVDLSISKTIFTRLLAKLNVKNILDDRYLFTLSNAQQSFDFERFQIGRVVSLSVSYGL